MTNLREKLKEERGKSRLGNVAKITNGKSNTQDAISDGTYPFFDRSVLVKRSDKFLFDDEAIILPGEGKEFVPKYYKGKFDLHQRAYSIIPNEKINGLFLFYYLFAKRSEFERTSVGSTVKSLRLPFIQEISVYLPSLEIQKQIAEILSKVDEDIEATDKIIKKTERLKRGLMQELLTKGIGHKKFKKTKLGMIPGDWEVKKIGDYVIHVGSGATPRGGSKVYLDKGIPFIRSQNVYFSGLNRKNLVFVSESIHKKMSRSSVLPKDILLNITGASLGRACIIPTDIPVANVNQHVCIIRPDKNLHFKYLFYFLQSLGGQKQIFTFQAGGNREGLNFQQIRSMRIPFPKNIIEQKEIAKILSKVDEKIEVYQEIKNKLKKLKKGLMQDLLK